MYQRCHSDILVYSFLATLSKIELYLAVMHIVDDCTFSSSHQTFIMFRVLMNRFPPSNRVPHGALTGSNEEIHVCPSCNRGADPVVNSFSTTLSSHH